jgi:prepilin-type N-terminal cleavage/methylation domain-containing protein
VSALQRLRGRLVRGEHDDEGFTMVEMIVVIGMLGMILAIVQGTLILTQRQLRGDSNRLQQVQQAQISTESMTKTLRSSVVPAQVGGTCSACATSAFIQANAFSAQFYAYLNDDTSVDGTGKTKSGPSIITLKLVGNALVQCTQRPDAHLPTNLSYTWTGSATFCSATSNQRTLARSVDTTQRMFVFYDPDAVVLSTGGAGTTNLSATDLTNVDSIDLTVRVQISGQTPSSSVTTRVTLPNADAIVGS